MKVFLASVLYVLVGYVTGAIFSSAITFSFATTAWSSVFTWLWLLFWPVPAFLIIAVAMLAGVVFILCFSFFLALVGIEMGGKADQDQTE